MISGDDCELAVNESELVPLFVILDCPQLVTRCRVNIIPTFLLPFELLILLFITLALSTLLLDFENLGAKFDGSCVHHHV